MKSASLNAVLVAREEIAEAKTNSRSNVDKNNLAPMELEPERQSVPGRGASVYIASFPKGENVPAIRYKLGVLYYYHNQFDEALNSFNSIISDYPKSQYAKFAANLTLDIFNLEKGLRRARGSRVR